jgi:hypothetical protein
MERDPAAASGAIRAFFLNATEAVAVLTGVPAAAIAITSLGGDFPAGAIPSLAYAVASLALAAVLELERRRTHAAPGTPRLFERLHLYGVLLILVFIATPFWIGALQATFGRLLMALRLVPACDPHTPVFNPLCLGPSLLSQWGAALVVALAWAVYFYLASGDTRSLLRVVEQMLGFGYGVIVALFGVYGVLNELWRLVLRVPLTWLDVAEQASLAALVFGALVAAVYFFWLRRERATSTLGAPATDLTLVAVVAALLAVPFWWGVGLVLYRSMQTLGGVKPGAETWAQALALTLTGVGYIPLALALRRLTAESEITSPRRAFVLAALAAGTLAAAVGAAVALYALGTRLLGAPLANWADVARGGAASLIVGAALAGLYLWTATRERLLSLPSARQAATMPSVAEDGASSAPSRRVPRA